MRKSIGIYLEPQTKEDMIASLKESIIAHEAVRMGHSGWIGYDMFCRYSVLMSERNSKIISKNRSTEATVKNQKYETSPMNQEENPLDSSLLTE